MTEYPRRLRCIFCHKRIPLGGGGNDILHHTIPACIPRIYGWLQNKEVAPEVKKLISKSRIPLCPSCHRKYHNLIRPLIELIRNGGESLTTPPAEFVFILRGVDEKYGVEVKS